MNKLDNLLASYPAAMIVMLLCAAAIVWLQYLTPWQGDDLYYGLWTKDSMLGEGPGIDFDTSWAFIKEHYYTINGRLGDKLIVLILSYMPKWLFAAITGLACLSTFYFGCLLAFGSVRRHPMRSIMLTGVFICLLPWFCSILIANYALNYVWGAGLSAIAVYMFVRAPRPHSKWLYAATFIVSLLSAWWHEAYSVPIVPGMILFMLIMRKEKSVIRYVVLAGSVAGVILVLAAPGFWVRTEFDIFHPTLAQLIRCAIIGPGLSWGVVAGLFLFYFRKYRTNFDRLTISTTCMATCTLTVIIAILFNSIYAVRMFWYLDVFVFPVVAMLCVPFIKYISPLLRQAICLCLMLFIVIHLCVAIHRQAFLTREFGRIVAEYTASDDGVVFNDIDFVNSGPVLAMRKASMLYMLPEYRANSDCMTNFYRSDSLPISLVPKGLKNFDIKSFPKGKTVMRHERGFVSRDSILNNYRNQLITLKFTKTNGGTTKAIVLINPFRAKDGTPLYYFEIDRRVVNDDIIDVEL